MNKTELINKISPYGIYIHTEEIKNCWIFTKQNALKVLNIFLEAKIPILGGDVGKYKDAHFEYNNDNWSCNIIKKESLEAYLQRSINITKKYIENYPLDDVYFAFVFLEDTKRAKDFWLLNAF